MAPKPKVATTKSTKRKVPTVRQVSKKAAITTSSSPLKRLSYRGLLSKKRVKRSVIISSAWGLTKVSAMLLWRHKKLFAGITLTYGLLNLVLAQGLGGTSAQTLKDQIGLSSSGSLGGLASSALVFAGLIGSAGNSSSNTAGAYQLFLGLIASLAVIWALRQTLAGTKLRIRDAYYRGMYPLIPFVLVLLVVGLQLLPMAIGSSLYNVVLTNGIAVYAAEKFLWGLLFGSLALLSLYMISSSLFALYIVTLPDMTPMKALRSARELVRHRRWTVLRKVLFLPIVLLATAAIIMVPIIIWLTALAQWVFFLLTMASLVAAHTYMYSLYRELLRD